MIFGTEKTTFKIDENSSLAKIEKYRNGNVEHNIKQYKIRIKVTGSKQEMAEFIKFSNEISKHRDDKTLAIDREDRSTLPAFVIEYPQERLDYHYIVKSYCVIA